MANDAVRRISPHEAQAKAAECLAMSRRAAKPEHRTMLEHMAETWQFLARNLETEIEASQGVFRSSTAVAQKRKL